MKGTKKQGRDSEISVPGVDLEQLEQILAFMSEHGLEEFEYSNGTLTIRLKKAATRSAAAPVQYSSPVAAAVDHSPAPSTPVAAAAAPVPAAPAPETLHIIKSPIVGTFYMGPSPEAEPFVKAGDTVEVGQTVCIVEAMKLMNEIEADIAGQVVRVMVENGHPVEYGEQLFAIRPRGSK
jgi:acetyl-CoA carboxylase biotin carboxyl carrier protein